MDTVSFTRMDQGTAEDYALVGEQIEAHTRATLADNVLGTLKMMRGPKLGYKVDRYEHSLQTATRALRDGADEETVVVALLHDIGDVLAPDNHSQYAASVLRPYVSEENHWILKPKNSSCKERCFSEKLRLERQQVPEDAGERHDDIDARSTEVIKRHQFSTCQPAK